MIALNDIGNISSILITITISGGQRQRTCIAMQLLSGSDFLLMDEPLSGLDPLMIDKTIKLLIDVSQHSEIKTIIIVSHDLRNCVAISNDVFVLSNSGRSETEGASIVRSIKLQDRGISWRPMIKEEKVFLDTIREIKNLL